MPSLRMTVLAVAASCVAVVNADYYIEPDSVPISQRRVWCQNTKEACPLICEQTSKGEPKVNSCDPETLTYGCICSDNKQPNVSEYSLTIPYYVCQEWGNQCVEDCKGSNSCASSCREDHPCGASDPKRYNTTATATTGTEAVKATASTTDDADTIFTGNPGGDDSNSGSDSSTSKNGSSALEAGRTWGLAVVLSTMFVGFAML